nr:immunoglobulin heavy chain junction region [Macaca mulatta]
CAKLAYGSSLYW